MVGRKKAEHFIEPKPYVNKGGSHSWRLDLRRFGQGQLFFSTEKEALARRDAIEKQLSEHGRESLKVTEEERIRFAAARDKLATVGGSIEAAVDFFLKHARPRQHPITMQELLSRCLVDKNLSGKRKRYLEQLKSSTLSFCRAGHADTLAHHISQADVTAWITSNAWKPKTRNVYLTDLRTLFSWAVKQGYATRNPCEGVTRADEYREEEIHTLTLEECRKLLLRAAAPKRGVWRKGLPLSGDDEDFRSLLGYVVLAMFAGIRPNEIADGEKENMSWADIDIDHKTVIVTGARSKTRQRRVVDLSDNAIAWLKLCDRNADLVPVNFRRRWARLRESCGWASEARAEAITKEAPNKKFKEWPHDVLRHTFASMHYAHHKNEHLLKMQMGHRDGEVLFTNYRALKKPTEAAEFWALLPPKELMPQTGGS